MANKMQGIANLTTKQKVMAGVLALVLLVIFYQLFGLFGGGSAEEPPAMAMTPAAPNTAAPGNMQANSPTANPQSPQQITPQPAAIPTDNKPQVMSAREIELIKLQQETQARYIAALNELQMLKVSRDIAETNQAIMTAKLNTIANEKKIVDLLTPPIPTPTFTQTTTTTGAPSAPSNIPTPASPQSMAPAQQEANYTVVSVSLLEHKWNAVIGYQGNLYNIYVGDILPADGSKVVGIDKSGVTLLSRDGVTKKVSLVPII